MYLGSVESSFANLHLDEVSLEKIDKFKNRQKKLLFKKCHPPPPVPQKKEQLIRLFSRMLIRRIFSPLNLPIPTRFIVKQLYINVNFELSSFKVLYREVWIYISTKHLDYRYQGRN